MSTLSELLGLLEKIPVWKRISHLPEEFDALKLSLAELEKKISGGGTICPKCGQMTFQLTASKPDKIFGDLGAQRRTYQCSNCGLSESKIVD